MDNIKTNAEINATGNKTANKLDKLLYLAELSINNISMIAILALMFLVVAEVFLRYLIHRPIKGYIDYMEMLMVVVVFLSLPLSQKNNCHIRMEVILDKMKTKAKITTEQIFLILSLVAFLVVTIFSADSARQAYLCMDTSLAIQIPTWPSRVAVPLGIGFLCLRFMMQIYFKLIGYDEEEEIKKCE